MKRIRNIVGLAFLTAAFFTAQENALASRSCSWVIPNQWLYCSWQDEPYTCAQFWTALGAGQVCGEGWAHIGAECYDNGDGTSDGWVDCYDY